MADTRQHISSISLTFLGTASAQPSSTRNHSALAVRLGGAVWLFDCGEATQHQVQQSTVKMGKIEKIFITHTHGDHIFGLVPLLAACLNGAGGIIDGVDDPREDIGLDKPPLEIYGPRGTRAYVRSALTYTYTKLGAPYVVHELWDTTEGVHDAEPLAQAESPHGCNILPTTSSNDNILSWHAIYIDPVIAVHAAPIAHSVPCVGYSILEAPVPAPLDAALYIPHLRRTGIPMSMMRVLQSGGKVSLPDGMVLRGPSPMRGRKVVILGDTYDPGIGPGAWSWPEDLRGGRNAEGDQVEKKDVWTDLGWNDADLLVHEATNAFLPGDWGTVRIGDKPGETEEMVEARARSRGHSTPQMAGAFAKRVNAHRLVLNHFSARYPGDTAPDSIRVMEAIAALAKTEFQGQVLCARDFMSVDVPSRKQSK